MILVEGVGYPRRLGGLYEVLYDTTIPPLKPDHSL